MYASSVSEAGRNVQRDSIFSLPAQRLDLYLEQVHAADCQNPGIPLLKATNSAHKIALLFKPRCKLWTCPECAVVNSSVWTWRAVSGCRDLMASGQAVDFLTLTSHEKLNAAGTLAVMPRAWKKLKERARRASATWDYLVIPEAHKNGRMHLHALTTAGLARRWWKDNARACGMGYQSDLQEVVKVGSVAGYVGKYLGKSLQFSNYAKGFRRVRTSQSWPKLPELDHDAAWVIEKLDMKMSISHEVKTLQRQGFAVIRADQKTAWKLIGTSSEADGDQL